MKKEKCSAPCRTTSVGGQAVIEGVMMKNQTDVALAIRKADGTIEIKKSEFHPAKEKRKWLNIPILRGIVGFIESMKLSFKTLGDSTNMLGLDELEEKERAEKEAKKSQKKAKKKCVSVDEIEKKPEEVSEKDTKKKKKDSSTGLIMAVSLILGLALALFLFMILPTFITDLINIPINNYGHENHLYEGNAFITVLKDDNGIPTGYALKHVLQAIIEGIIRILIFIIYLASVSLMKDIKRTFAYHGAEHKSIACYEAGLELTPENARKCSRFHPRCGTSFLFVMLIISIIIGIFIPEFESMPWLRYVLKIATIPLVMGIGYEFIMLAGKHRNWLTKALSAPGLWMQRITTKEPDDYQLAVAICAIKATMPEEFPDFDPSEYFISIYENRDHILYEEELAKKLEQRYSEKTEEETEEKAENVSENTENE